MARLVRVKVADPLHAEPWRGVFYRSPAERSSRAKPPVHKSSDTAAPLPPFLQRLLDVPQGSDVQSARTTIRGRGPRVRASLAAERAPAMDDFQQRHEADPWRASGAARPQSAKARSAATRMEAVMEASSANGGTVLTYGGRPGELRRQLDSFREFVADALPTSRSPQRPQSARPRLRATQEVHTPRAGAEVGDLDAALERATAQLENLRYDERGGTLREVLAEEERERVRRIREARPVLGRREGELLRTAPAWRMSLAKRPPRVQPLAASTSPTARHPPIPQDFRPGVVKMLVPSKPDSSARSSPSRQRPQSATVRSSKTATDTWSLRPDGSTVVPLRPQSARPSASVRVPTVQSLPRSIGSLPGVGAFRRGQLDFQAAQSNEQEPQHATEPLGVRLNTFPQSLRVRMVSARAGRLADSPPRPASAIRI